MTRMPQQTHGALERRKHPHAVVIGSHQKGGITVAELGVARLETPGRVVVVVAAAGLLP